MIPTNEEWQRKRKLDSTAFYKDKLLQMTEVMKNLVAEKVGEIEAAHLNKGTSFDIMKELYDLHSKIIITTAFGREAQAVTIPYIKNGVTLQLSLGEALREMFMFLAFRGFRSEYVVCPYLILAYFYRYEDREYTANCRNLRQFCRDFIEKRRKELEKYKSHSDLLTIMLLDEHYTNQTEVIIDECITFFLAGSNTVISANCNMIQYLLMNP